MFETIRGKVLPSLIAVGVAGLALTVALPASGEVEHGSPDQRTAEYDQNAPQYRVMLDIGKKANSRLLVRRDVKDMTRQQKHDFVAAVKKLKRTPPPDNDNRVSNWYDHFVAEHVAKVICWNHQHNQGGFGHMGSDVLTFHRAFLLEFEAALTKVAGKPIAVPYWDWTNPASTKAMLSNDMMGPSGKRQDDYYVTSGPFRRGEFRINVKGFPSTNPGQFDWIVRAVGTRAKQPPSAADVKFALARPKYNVAPWDEGADQNKSRVINVMGVTGGPTATEPNPGPLGMACEAGIMSTVNVTGLRLHTQAHDYIGGMNDEGQPGSESDVVTSPNDPAFWLIHSYLDKLSERWWSKHNYQYLPKRGGPRGDNYHDIIEPYANITNGDMAVSAKSLGYKYR